MTEQQHPEGYGRGGLDHLCRGEDAKNDAGRFLGIIPAVAQAIEDRTEQLATAKEPVDGPRRGPAEAPRQREHTPEAEDKPKQRRHHDEEQCRRNPAPHERL